jgi:hypothetical protein
MIINLQHVRKPPMTIPIEEPEDAGYPDTSMGTNTSVTVQTITFVGQPLMFIAIDASAMMPGGVPLAVSWTPNAATRPVSRIIKPPMDWQDRPRDDDESAIHGLTMNAVIRRGEPLQEVARDVHAALHGHRLISVFPSLDRLWLNELFLPTTLDPCRQFLSLSDLALKIAAKTGLDDDAFTRAAIHDWFKVFKPRPAEQRVQHMAGMTQAIVEAAAAKGLIDPDQPFEIDG